METTTEDSAENTTNLASSLRSTAVEQTTHVPALSSPHPAPHPSSSGKVVTSPVVASNAPWINKALNTDIAFESQFPRCLQNSGSNLRRSKSHSHWNLLASTPSSPFPPQRTPDVSQANLEPVHQGNSVNEEDAAFQDAYLLAVLDGKKGEDLCQVVHNLKPNTIHTLFETEKAHCDDEMEDQHYSCARSGFERPENIYECSVYPSLVRNKQINAVGLSNAETRGISSSEERNVSENNILMGYGQARLFQSTLSTPMDAIGQPENGGNGGYFIPLDLSTRIQHKFITVLRKTPVKAIGNTGMPKLVHPNPLKTSNLNLGNVANGTKAPNNQNPGESALAHAQNPVSNKRRNTEGLEATLSQSVSREVDDSMTYPAASLFRTNKRRKQSFCKR